MDLRAKKSLGQNFLKNKKILERMIEKADIEKDDLVLEIGPGKGALTAEILKRGYKLIGVEKDKRMVEFLQEKFVKEIKRGQFVLFEGDALKLDYDRISLKNKKFSILANLPYYITGKFLSNVFKKEIFPKKVVLLLQKEIVERISGEIRKDGKIIKREKENLLSLSIKVYSKKIKNLLLVGKKNFQPEPKVDSAVILIDEISRDFFEKNKIDEREFFDFLKLAFGNKRKKMIKNLSSKFDKKNLISVFDFLNLDLNSRAEDLKLDDFKRLYLNLKNN